ncbi:hypothetical protein [Bacillus sp. 1NLA3E]|uniref:hypothetical protein n=1 Tax=Bacillus sp. 1NLA3E TaxID=666686 RepID=UPI000247EBA6|nr:hypothetical protein [Bacillus sp. 1NLA3E]
MAKKEEYSNFSNVEKQKNFLTAEEFPEGPYGSPVGQDEPVENKNTPWQEGQQFYSNFTYENRNLHQDLPRQYPGAHPTHSEKNKNEE